MIVVKLQWFTFVSLHLHHHSDHDDDGDDGDDDGVHHYSYTYQHHHHYYPHHHHASFFYALDGHPQLPLVVVELADAGGSHSLVGVVVPWSVVS